MKMATSLSHIENVSKVKFFVLIYLLKKQKLYEKTRYLLLIVYYQVLGNLIHWGNLLSPCGYALRYFHSFFSPRIFVIDRTLRITVFLRLCRVASIWFCETKVARAVRIFFASLGLLKNCQGFTLTLDLASLDDRSRRTRIDVILDLPLLQTMARVVRAHDVEVVGIILRRNCKYVSVAGNVRANVFLTEKLHTHLLAFDDVSLKARAGYNVILVEGTMDDLFAVGVVHPVLYTR